MAPALILVFEDRRDGTSPAQHQEKDVSGVWRSLRQCGESSWQGWALHSGRALDRGSQPSSEAGRPMTFGKV
jgi:hypothetical protein